MAKVNVDDRWAAVLGHKAAAPERAENPMVGPLGTDDARAMRNQFARQNPGYVPGTWAPLRIDTGRGFVRYIGRRSISHHSTQLYLVVIVGESAFHYLVTQKCEFKRQGVATPTPEELEAWNKAYPQ